MTEHNTETTADAVRPVTIDRVQAFFERNGANMTRVSDQSIRTNDFGNFISFTVGELELSTWSLWRPSTPSALREELIATCNQWNAEMKLPRASVRDLDGAIRVCVDYLTVCRAGMNDEQLEQTLKVFLSTTVQFFRHLDEKFPELSTTSATPKN